MPDEMTKARLAAEAWSALLHVHAALVPRLDRELQKAVGLPLTWYDVLLELHDATDRRLRMSDLGERVVLSRTRVSRLVEEMASAGLVRRESNPDDRRSAYAVLTPEGLKRFRRAAPVYVRGIGRHFGGGLSGADLRSARDILNRVLG